MKAESNTKSAASDGWVDIPADEGADLMVSAMAHGGVEHLFFTSGSDILSFQESIAKAEAKGLPAPKLITTLHEAVALNAAVGSAMIRRKPAATAVHVDVGLQNHGCAIHNAHASNSPVLIMAGSAPRAYPGSCAGARNHPIYWVQDKVDQREALTNYVKWRFRMELQDNPGLVVSRALQVALSGLQGPAFLSVPREVMMAPATTKRFPTTDHLGIARRCGPDPDAIDRLAGWLLEAKRPLIITGRSGKDPQSVVELVRVAESIGAGVTDNGFFGDRLNFPTRHPLWETGPAASEADVVFVVDNKVPWVPAPLGTIVPTGDGGDASAIPAGDPRRAPSAGCQIAWIAEDPVIAEIPMLEMAGPLRITADPTLGLRALADALERRITQAQRDRAAQRIAEAKEFKAKALEEDERAAHASLQSEGAMDPRWVAYQIGRIVDDEAIFLDESLSNARLTRRYVRSNRPHSWFGSQGSGGGWCSGAAFGAKLADPSRDVIFASGDGYYMFGSPSAALWSAVKYKAPYLGIIYVNQRYSTGVDEVTDFYPDSFAAAAGYAGGRFDPAPDFAAEARAVGAHGEKVTDPQELEGALKRGLAATREGKPAIVAVMVS